MYRHIAKSEETTLTIYGRRRGLLDVPPERHSSAAPSHVRHDERAHARAAATLIEWASVRKAMPANHLLPMSAKWLRAFPHEAAPCALAAQFPRIVNMIALQWDNRSACSGYFESLITDARGGRTGFPAPVREELLRLREFWYTGAIRRES